jgi:hypothetical protein
MLDYVVLCFRCRSRWGDAMSMVDVDVDVDVQGGRWEMESG